MGFLSQLANGSSSLLLIQLLLLLPVLQSQAIDTSSSSSSASLDAFPPPLSSAVAAAVVGATVNGEGDVCPFGKRAPGVAPDFRGYFCPACASTPDPEDTLQHLPKAYTHLVVSFLGWDVNGTVIDTINCADTAQPSQCTPAQLKFKLDKKRVASLKKINGGQLRGIYVSLGGGAAGIIAADAPAGFASRLAKGVLAAVDKYGFDGIDLDMEHRSGDIVTANTIMSNFVTTVKKLRPKLPISSAPQMPNINFQVETTVQPGVNGLVPFFAHSTTDLETVGPQMYNTWAAVETGAFATE